MSEKQKQQAAESALEYVKTSDVIGVGTGSTVNCFIDALAHSNRSIDGAVASSEATRVRLEQHNIPVLDLNQTGQLPVYIDGADESDHHLRLIKGGGGALAREKVIAGASRLFVCIADESKLVDTLGSFPLPIEVLPLAQSAVARKIAALGGTPGLRQTDNKPFVTDNNNIILDVTNLDMTDPVTLETEINQIPGVVAVGLFAHRPADVLLLATSEGVKALMG